MDRCDALGTAPYSDSGDGLFRAWLTPAHRAAQQAIAGWMEEAGMAVRMDAASNLVGRYEGSRPDAPALLIGSHIDSVRDAGRYDGPLGVMLGIECVAALHRATRRLPFAIEVIAFGDEEGSRFPASMFTSRALAGTLDAATLDGVVDGDGIPVAAALAAWGLDAALIGAAARDPAAVIGYLEAHIEQGPVLEAEGLPLGIVTGIAAQLRFNVSVDGRAGHAGTCPMPLRHDALAAAAACVLAVEAAAREAGGDLVATVGRMQVLPGATNVIPGRVEFSLDVRAGRDDLRDAGAGEILRRFRRIAGERGVEIAAEPVQDLGASPCDPALTKLLEQAVAAQGIAPRRLLSGAGHDAMVMTALCPTAMLFVRCEGGISHNPAEHVEAEDASVAVAAMLGFVERLGTTMTAGTETSIVGAGG
ncbi:allantoate amidohydrolase [Stenotrophomonas sp. MMGLT7]|nr:allantoate amidohydrolase [Stenotrophomonas sp. MMGLT7]